MSKKNRRGIARRNGFLWNVSMEGSLFEVQTIGATRQLLYESGPISLLKTHTQPDSVQVVLSRGGVRFTVCARQVGQASDHHRCTAAAVLVPLNIRPSHIGYDVNSHNGHTSATLRATFGEKQHRKRLSVAEGAVPADAVAHAAVRLANETLGIL